MAHVAVHVLAPLRPAVVGPVGAGFRTGLAGRRSVSPAENSSPKRCSAMLIPAAESGPGVVLSATGRERLEVSHAVASISGKISRIRSIVPHVVFQVRVDHHLGPRQ